MARNERINKTAGQPSVDSPFGGRGTPDIKAPKKGHAGRNIVVFAAGAAIVAAGAFEASQINKGSQQRPESTQPVGIVEPSNSPIPTLLSPGERIVIPSPTPEPATPAPTEKPMSIELVKVNGGYAIEGLAPEPPYFDISVNRPTITAIENIDNTLWLALTVGGGTTIEKSNCATIENVSSGTQVPLTECQYTNVTFWMQVNNHFKISQYEGGNYDVIGFGKDTILPHIKVGGSLWVADFVFSPLHGFEGQQNTAENYDTYLKLKGSAGETWNRRDKTFIFYAGYLSLAP